MRAGGVTHFAWVPDAGHDAVMRRAFADPSVRAIPLATEDEGVAHAAGAWRGRARAALLMQSSGIGNRIDLLSLIRAGRFPLVTLVSMRGEFGEGNPLQVPMDQSTRPVLEACGVVLSRGDRRCRRCARRAGRADDGVPVGVRGRGAGVAATYRREGLMTRPTKAARSTDPQVTLSLWASSTCVRHLALFAAHGVDPNHLRLTVDRTNESRLHTPEYAGPGRPQFVHESLWTKKAT